MDKALLRQGVWIGSLVWILVPLIVGASAISAVAGPTTRVSVNSAGEETNLGAARPSISANGRFVAFTSSASNLVPDDTNGQDDVFVHDRKTGVTTRVSVNSAGEEATGGGFPIFGNSSTNLVPGDTNGTVDVFVHDRKTGGTTRVSVNSAGEEGGRSSDSPSISASGRFVAFQSFASNLVPEDTNGTIDVFVHDRKTGVTTRVSVDSAGGEGTGGVGPFGSFDPSISATGRFVAFDSFASNLVPGDTNEVTDAFVHDRKTGVTSRVSVDSAGGGGRWKQRRCGAFGSGAVRGLPVDRQQPRAGGHEWDRGRLRPRPEVG
jgi:Tol biopolymer transport system component